jgi:two-component system, NtrC family, response regulator AtoC
MKRVLVVDDEQRMRRVLQILIEKLGLDSHGAPSAEAALEYFQANQVDLVLTDLKMTGMGGLELLARLRAIDPDVPVIVLTAYGTISSAVDAMKLGAFDFLLKPFDRAALEMLVRKALDLSRWKMENRYLREQAGGGPGLSDKLAGEAPAMQPVYDIVRQVAPTRSAVLITGETGSGKEVLARAIHELSPRAGKLFVPLNCTAIPADLLESELFGHVRGAFTGAQTERVGKCRAADEGTLFLDEIGDMDYRLQAKLLRFLEEGVIEPVGSNLRIAVDVRVISSTNRDLAAAIREGKFRQDLFYRLNVFHIEVPALRARREDIPRLAAVFLRQFSQELGKGPISLTAEAGQLLSEYSWPGNVRELRNFMERAAVLCSGPELGKQQARWLLPAESEPVPADYDLERAIAAVERKTILRALAAANDNKVAAAALLGIGERTLWSKLKKHGL